MLLWIDPTNAPIFNLDEQDYQKVIQIYENIKKEADRSEIFYRQIVRYSIIELLFRINRIEKSYLHDGKKPSTQGYKIYKNFQALVNEHYKEKKSVQEYAELLHLTPSHLSAIIKEQSGQTALEVIHKRIITEAKNMLGFTNKPAKQIAYSLGFNSPSNFSRFFKHKTNISPTSYRKKRSIAH